jgi:hypothetical protein
MNEYNSSIIDFKNNAIATNQAKGNRFYFVPLAKVFRPIIQPLVRLGLGLFRVLPETSIYNSRLAFDLNI